MAIKWHSTKPVNPTGPFSCDDIKQVRQRALHKAWEIAKQKKIPYKDAVKQGWKIIKDECTKKSE